MRIIKLSKQDEEKWLEDIKSDREEFLYRLYRILEQKDNNIKIKASNNLLTSLFLDCHNIETDNNEYKEFYYTFLKYDRMDYSLINYILSKFDLTDFKYHNLKLDNNALKIMSDCKIVLDLNNLYSKDLSCRRIESLKISGSFDGFKLNNTTIINNTDINGNKIKINPQTVFNKDLSSSIIRNVIFTDNFDGCNIKGIDLKNNESVIINPKKIKDASLYGCKISNAKFTDSLDNCDIVNMQLDNVENAYLEYSKKFNDPDDNIRFNSIKILIKNDKQFEMIKDSYDWIYTRQFFSGATIVCNLKQRKYFTSFNDKMDIKYEILNSTMDDDILSALGTVVDLDHDDILDSPKEKKKSLFDVFKRR